MSALTRVDSQLGTLFETPALYPFQFDFARRKTLLALADESFYRRSVFLDERSRPADDALAWCTTQALLARLENATASVRPATFLFHIGHCGSTLLTHLLADHPGCLPVREPLSLRALATARRHLDRPESFLSRERWEKVFRLTMALLSRAFMPSQRALIKASSNGANLIAPALETHPEHNAVWLYVDLETYLAGMLRPQARNGLYGFAEDRILDLHALLRGRAPPLAELNEARLGTMHWLTGMMLACRAAETPGVGDRLRWLHFQDVLDAPIEQLPILDGLIGIKRSRNEIEAMLSCGYLNRYSKDPRFPYTPQLRADELALSRRKFGDEIRTGLLWAETLLADAGSDWSRVAARLRPPGSKYT